MPPWDPSRTVVGPAARAAPSLAETPWHSAWFPGEGERADSQQAEDNQASCSSHPIGLVFLCSVTPVPYNTGWGTLLLYALE